MGKKEVEWVRLRISEIQRRGDGRGSSTTETKRKKRVGTDTRIGTQTCRTEGTKKFFCLKDSIVSV